LAQNLFDLSGKTALVTGARKGIGLAMARTLAENGADLIVVSSKQTLDDDLTRYVTGLGRKITALTFDLRYRKDTKALVETVQGTKIDILINNAGIANRGEVLVHTDEQWDETLEIDLTAPFILSRDIAKGMAERGYGKIIFTASMWSYLGGKNVISYTAAKTALVRQDKERFAFISSRIPSGKWGKPEDLAGTTLFLSAPASDYVSGVVIPVDGGYLAN
jgi:2-deoxy-D-gluconate 3-dehydrogenase